MCRSSQNTTWYSKNETVKKRKSSEKFWELVVKIRIQM